MSVTTIIDEWPQRVIITRSHCASALRAEGDASLHRVCIVQTIYVAGASLFAAECSHAPADNKMRSEIRRFVLVLVGLVSGIQAQAPGDGDLLCVNETVDGMQNPFFADHPVYSANERPLMDSRDYIRLLQQSIDTYIPWQSVDRDNNNTGDFFTEVRFLHPYDRIMQVHVLVSSGLNRGQSHVRDQ